MERFKYLLSLFSFFLVLSCSKKNEIKLTKFPDKFYDVMQYNKDEELYLLVSGDNIYSENSKKLIDSLAFDLIPKSADSFTICLFKENESDGLTSADFGQQIESFGDEWESTWDYLRYSVIEIEKNKYKKKVYLDSKLLELKSDSIR